MYTVPGSLLLNTLFLEKKKHEYLTSHSYSYSFAFEWECPRMRICQSMHIRNVVDDIKGFTIESRMLIDLLFIEEDGFFL